MRVMGLHVLAEMHDCESVLLNDLGHLEVLVKETASENGLPVEDSVFHQFDPEGVSGVLIIPNASFSLHTWPQNNRVTVDAVACCEDMDLLALCDALVTKLGAGSMTTKCSKREIEIGQTACTA